MRNLKFKRGIAMPMGLICMNVVNYMRHALPFPGSCAAYGILFVISVAVTILGIARYRCNREENK